MKKFLVVSIATICMCGQAVAQQQPMEYSLKVTNDDLNTISEALNKEPFGKVVNLIGRLRQQIVEQQMPKAPIPPVKKSEEPEQK